MGNAAAEEFLSSADLEEREQAHLHSLHYTASGFNARMWKCSISPLQIHQIVVPRGPSVESRMIHVADASP
ncbi:hypothetical protein JMJ77_0013403 [Colletotrichum scovillei]|uniref:Uncharacterized protein n=1 Tax=Colletotrichum scovillei TaxID=1209932 RepID=A0A9P7UIL0_9PEZI|nr:hypothetical protein JMJ77_0013403 [Colletotrichum scovillei]KAG7069704.1 hypothetical protein JMJ76_0003367 [Colletotrichum scovillei]KAG7073650.1 hypothetical protein JMJ78_0014620 [Colletotrichum scovillei]